LKAETCTGSWVNATRNKLFLIDVMFVLLLWCLHDEGMNSLKIDDFITSGIATERNAKQRL
jgi:hypothetical protein